MGVSTVSQPSAGNIISYRGRGRPSSGNVQLGASSGLAVKEIPYRARPRQS